MHELTIQIDCNEENTTPEQIVCRGAVIFYIDNEDKGHSLSHGVSDLEIFGVVEILRQRLLVDLTKQPDP